MCVPVRARLCVLGHLGNHKGTSCGFSRLLTVDSNYALLHNTDDWRRAQNVAANDNQMEPGGGQEGMSWVWATLGAVGGTRCWSTYLWMRGPIVLPLLHPIWKLLQNIHTALVGKQCNCFFSEWDFWFWCHEQLDSRNCDLIWRHRVTGSGASSVVCCKHSGLSTHLRGATNSEITAQQICPEHHKERRLKLHLNLPFMALNDSLGTVEVMRTAVTLSASQHPAKAW